MQIFSTEQLHLLLLNILIEQTLLFCEKIVESYFFLGFIEAWSEW